MSDPIRDHALRYLAQRMTTVGHLRTLLLRGARKREPDAARDELEARADAVLADLVRIGALDDEAWARAKVATLRQRGNPVQGIRAKLRERQVPAHIVQAILDEEDEDARVLAALRHLRRRRLGSWGPDGDPRAALTKLARAGFPYGIALRAVSMPAEEAHERAGW